MKLYSILLRISIVFLIFFVAFPTLSESIDIDDNFTSISIKGSSIEILEDPSAVLTFDQIKESSNFKRKFSGVPNFGYSSSAYWMRFTLHNRSSQPKDFILELSYALLNYVYLYVPNGTDYTVQKTGRGIPASQKKVNHRNCIFPFSLSAESSSVIYLRIESGDALVAPLRLMTPMTFALQGKGILIILGFLFGFLLVILLYNLFIYLILKDRNYLHLVFFIFVLLMYFFIENGIAGQYFWPEIPWLSMNLIPFVVSLVITASAKFTLSFIEPEKYFLWMKKVFVSFQYVGLALALLSLVIVNFSYLFVIILVVSVIVVYAGILMTSAFLCWQKGSKEAQYFFISWIFISIGTVIYGLKAFGILPENFLTHQGVAMGAALQVVLLSLGLADRINRINNEVITLQKDLNDRAQFLQSILEKAGASSKELYLVSTEQDDMAAQFSEFSQDQAALAEEMAASFEELTASMESINETIAREEEERKKQADAIDLLKISQQSVFNSSRAVSGNVSEIGHATEKTSEHLKTMVNVMQVISEGGKAINSFITIINDITDQINLLSLNAAIEAARAGDHGKGFAVVADEIAKLATATSDNSKEISDQMQKIISDIDGGMEIVHNAEESTEDIVSRVTSIRNNMDEVTAAMVMQQTNIATLTKQSLAMEEISEMIVTSAKEQEISMAGSNSSIIDLSTMAQKIAEATEKINKFAEIIKNRAQSLQNIITETDTQD